MTQSKTTRGEIPLLLRLLEENYQKHAWQGPNLKGALRGVTAEQAAWRPAPGRHSIQELVVHSAYWKYAVRRLLTGEKAGSFPEKGSNWFARPGSAGPGEAAWKADRAMLEQEHRLLRAAVEKLKPSDLRRPKTPTRSVDTLLYGVASHDAYHTGQIQLLKRLWQDRSKSR